MCVQKIISGGQSGVDRAALNTAMRLGVPCGGWCPKGRRAEDGRISKSYPLQETASPIYAVRTRLNVEEADGTLVFTWGKPTGGTALTIACVRQSGKPGMVVDLANQPTVEPVRGWLEQGSVHVLNVAGPRASTCPEIGYHTSQFLASLLGVQAMAAL